MEDIVVGMKASRAWAVVGLSVVVGSGWLLTEAYPSEMGFPFAGCVHFAVIGLAGMLLAGRGGWLGWSWNRAVDVAGAGLGVFVLPGVVNQLAAGAVSTSASVALFCAVPLMMVLGMAAFGEGAGRGLMMPSLVGLFGALLIFSVEVPGSLRQAVGLAAVVGCCAVVAAAGVRMFRLMQGVSIEAAVAVVGVAGALVLGGYGLGIGWRRMTPGVVGVEAVRCVLFDLPVVWLTVWLMREVAPVRLGARFLIAPVVTWVEGYAMLRGAVEVRSVVALVLMAAGAGMLLVKDDEEAVAGLRLR